MAWASGQLTGRLADERARVEGLAVRLRRAAPARLGDQPPANRRSEPPGTPAITNIVQQQRARLRGEGLRLTALDPSRVLARGYAIVATADGAVVHSVAQVTPGDAVRVRVADGAFGATVTIDDGR